MRLISGLNSLHLVWLNFPPYRALVDWRRGNVNSKPSPRSRLAALGADECVRRYITHNHAVSATVR